jgi:N-acetylglucosaminyl-diphospho-decaprenol L-rhamnosyltransferase
VQAALANMEAEIIVVDNCSADGSIEYLQPYFPCVIFIQNKLNEGFAKANNKALKLAKGEFILFLNPDTILAEDTLQQCIDFFAEHTNAGAVGVRMIDGSGTFLPESKRAFPSPLVSFYKLTGLASLFPKSKIFNSYALGFLPQNAVHEVDVLAGAFMMAKKSVLDKIGGFDEQFFMYAEDIDLSYRIQKGGYRNYYLGNVTIIHFKGESTKKSSLRYVRMFYEAMRLFVKKHYSGAGAWLVNKGLYAGILLRQMVAALALPFYKKSTKNNPVVFQKVYLSGDALQTETAIKITKKNHPEAAIQLVNDVREIKTSARENALVLCAGSNLTYKEAIQLSQMYATTSLLMWSGKDSCSIVGSNDKNASGYVWY